MSTSFRASGGETWSIVAMQTTGNDLDADAIRRANPGVSEPLQKGAMIHVPSTPSQASSRPGNPAITVEGIDIGTFDEFEFGYSIDAIRKASFVVPNEKTTRDIFIPLYYPRIEISILDRIRMTGKCNSPSHDSGDVKTSAISCFSLPGILEVSGPPIDAFPLEYKDQGLQGIASDLCWKHGIETSFDADAGARFKRVDIQPGDSSLGFLSDLAKQRGLIISDDEHGRLVFWKGMPSGSPVGSYKKGMFPCIGVSSEINDDRYFSSVTGYITSRTRSDYKGQGYTIKNNYMTDVIRPYLERFESIDKGELATAVEALAGRMFSDVFSVTIDLATWFDEQGNLFAPNTTIMVQSEEDDIPEPFEFLIRTVNLSKQAEKLSCSLDCVIPGVFSGEIPERLPWQR